MDRVISPDDSSLIRDKDISKNTPSSLIDVDYLSKEDITPDILSHVGDEERKEHATAKSLVSSYLVPDLYSRIFRHYFLIRNEASITFTVCICSNPWERIIDDIKVALGASATGGDFSVELQKEVAKVITQRISVPPMDKEIVQFSTSSSYLWLCKPSSTKGMFDVLEASRLVKRGGKFIINAGDETLPVLGTISLNIALPSE